MELIPASLTDAPHIAAYLAAMNAELGDLPVQPATAEKAVRRAIQGDDNQAVHYFIFKTTGEKQTESETYGTCYLQAVHNYWSEHKRFYLGGFYIQPKHRGKGLFRQTTQALLNWAKANGGTQLYGHIHEGNAKSIQAFCALGFQPVEYNLYCALWDV